MRRVGRLSPKQFRNLARRRGLTSSSGGFSLCRNHVEQVEHVVIEQYTVVSRPVVEAMAQGVRNLMESDFGVATTGVAGPSGGTAESPVGIP